MREFSAWTEKTENSRREKQRGANGREVEVMRTPTGDDDLYLQENCFEIPACASISAVAEG